MTPEDASGALHQTALKGAPVKVEFGQRNAPKNNSRAIKPSPDIAATIATGTQLRPWRIALKWTPIEDDFQVTETAE